MPQSAALVEPRAQGNPKVSLGIPQSTARATVGESPCPRLGSLAASPGTQAVTGDRPALYRRSAAGRGVPVSHHPPLPRGLTQANLADILGRALRACRYRKPDAR